MPRGSSRRRRAKPPRQWTRAPVLAVLCAAVVVVVIAFVWISGRYEPRDVTAAEAITSFYLDGPFGSEFAGEMLADQRGYFETGGIKLKLLPGSSQEQVTDLVVRHNAIGVTTGQKFLLATWRGDPIVAFGASLLDTPTAIFTLEKSGIRSPQDLLGKRLSYQAGSEDAIVYDAMMAQLGLPQTQIHKIATPDGFAALFAGDVDAVLAKIGKQPQPSEDGRANFNIVRPPDYGIHIPGLVYFASSTLVRDHPSIVRNALQAVTKGWQEVYVDEKQSVPRIVGLDPVHLTSARLKFELMEERALVRPAGMRLGEFDETRWDKLRDILLYAKMGDDTVSLSSTVTYQFLRDIYRRPLNSEGIEAGSLGQVN